MMNFIFTCRYLTLSYYIHFISNLEYKSNQSTINQTINQYSFWFYVREEIIQITGVGVGDTNEI